MKVRIPYVINPAGKWCAYGYPSQEPDWDMCMEMADNGEQEDNYQRGWIEVDLPVPPENVVVAGSVMSEDGAEASRSRT
jgi:hypothetical protein